MPPYKPNVSKAQQRLMFALERRGELRPGEARGKAHASKGRHLPERKRRRRKSKGRQ